MQNQGQNATKKSQTFIGIICPPSQIIWDILGKTPFWKSVVRGLDYVSAPYQRYSDK